MIDTKSITVGTDAEIPLMLVTGEFFPATGIFGGTKVEPKPLGRLGAGFAVQEDNVNVEFNVPPARTSREFVSNVSKAIRQLQRITPPTMMLAFGTASAEYRPEWLKNQACQEFGCTPDLNVYTGERNPKPEAENKNLRTASGHIHVGWDNPTHEDREKLVKMLDLHCGFASVNIDDKARRQLYGKAGAYRVKDYGIEYRVLGNWWVQSHAETVWNMVMAAVQAVNQGTKLSEKEEAEIVKCINEGYLTDEGWKVAKKHKVWIQ